MRNTNVANRNIFTTFATNASQSILEQIVRRCIARRLFKESVVARIGESRKQFAEPGISLERESAGEGPSSATDALQMFAKVANSRKDMVTRMVTVQEARSD